MKTALAGAALLLTAALAACGSDGGATATDPGASGSTADRPAAAPAASGPVHTAGLVTVMDTGTPEVCLGPVAESYPPQCSGPELIGWDWADHEGAFDKQGAVRWGQFALTGTWDGTSLTPTDAIPAALYDSVLPEEPTFPVPTKRLGDAELEAIRRSVGDLPGAEGAYVDGPRVLVDVAYDDGSLQDWADAAYGEGVVVLHSMLVS
jgi:hypothetical protein